MRLAEIVMFGVGLVVTITGVALPMIIPRERTRAGGVGLLSLGLAILLLTAQIVWLDGTPTPIGSREFWELFMLVAGAVALSALFLRDLVRRWRTRPFPVTTTERNTELTGLMVELDTIIAAMRREVEFGRVEGVTSGERSQMWIENLTRLRKWTESAKVWAGQYLPEAVRILSRGADARRGHDHENLPLAEYYRENFDRVFSDLTGASFTVPSAAPTNSRGETGTTRAIAFPLAVSMTYKDDAVLVYCAVALYALDRAKESPTEVAIAISGGDEICRVEFPPGYQPHIVEPGAWHIMNYRGQILASEREQLASMVRHTRKLVTVEVELRIPGGAAGSAHHDSGVQFWLPPGMAGPGRLTAIIANWKWPETNHLQTANRFLADAFRFSNQIGVYGHAGDPLAHAPKLVEREFVRKVEEWEQNVRDFWTRSRDSQ